MGSVLGTDSTEAANLGNKYGIQIDEATNVMIGGTSSSGLNEISGNTSYGIQLVSAKNTTVIGNYIGTKKDGTTALANDSGDRHQVGVGWHHHRRHRTSG